MPPRSSTASSFRVGKDLQYIRINGTLADGLVN
jgi:uncharacterized membrane-anchored protein YjiN (DUF445 family)